MEIPDQKFYSSSSSSSDNNKHNNRVWGFLKMSFQGSNTAPSTPSTRHNYHHTNTAHVESSNNTSLSSVARSILPTRRRLKLDPSATLYFPYEPGKQVRSAIRIKNTTKSHVAFKFQTTAPKSCFMRPPGAILAPGEAIVATVFKFVELPESNEKPMDQKCKVKFKIMSLKVQGVMDYVPELFDEQKDQVTIEQILKVVFLDPERPNAVMEKLKRQLAEADAAVEAQKKAPEEIGSRIIGEGLVIDEWKERRERYLAQQQVEGVVDSSV